jgi:hypothetical protein
MSVPFGLRDDDRLNIGVSIFSSKNWLGFDWALSDISGTPLSTGSATRISLGNGPIRGTYPIKPAVNWWPTLLTLKRNGNFGIVIFWLPARSDCCQPQIGRLHEKIWREMNL